MAIKRLSLLLSLCRVQVLAGFANAVVLVFVALNICLEAGVHLMEGGHDVTTHRLLPVSVAGLAVNLLGLTFAHEAHHHAPGEPARPATCRPWTAPMHDGIPRLLRR